MSQVYTSVIRLVIYYTFLLGFFDLSVFQNLHCDEKSSMMQSNVSTLYCFFCLFCLFCFWGVFLFVCFFVFFVFFFFFFFFVFFNICLFD